MQQTKKLLAILVLSILVLISSMLFAQQAKITKRVMTEQEFNKLKEYCGVYEEGKNYNVIINGYGTGLKPPTEEQWEKIRKLPIMVDKMEFPKDDVRSSHDNSDTDWFPPIGNQGSEGSCVTWACGYYTKTFQEALEHSWDLSGCLWEDGDEGHPSAAYQDQIFSPDFIYHQINGGVDEGSSYWDAMNLLHRIGCCTWEKMPYDPNDSTTWPDEDAWRQAPLYRSQTGYGSISVVITDTVLVDLKQLLANGNLAVISILAGNYDSLTSTDLWTLDNYHPDSTNHANTIVGYDDDYGPYMEDGNPDTYGALKVANSRGVGGWENVADGFYYISYECMKQRVGYYMFYENWIDYEPEMISVFQISHDLRGECETTVSIGSISSPYAEKRFDYYWNGGSHPFPSNNMVMDITEFTPFMFGPPDYLFLGIYDSETTTTGTVNHFAVEIYDDYVSGIPIEIYSSANPPVNTIHDSTVYAHVITGPHTHILDGEVSGTWTYANSPYIIDGEIAIQSNDSLVIEPGVQVIFLGHNKFNIYGRLLAEGTATDTITFTAQDTLAGWHSLRFFNTNTNGQDSSKVVYCKLEYGIGPWDAYPPDCYGGAIYCDNSSDILIKNCLITKNTGVLGGGISCMSNSSPILINVTITGNTASDSDGGGISCRNNSSPTLTNVILTENTAVFGGGISCWNNCNPNINTITITKNTADYGGGVYCLESNPSLTNLTISDNSANLYGGGFWCYISNPTLLNCILWNDAPQEIYLSSGSVNATYSDIQGGWPGIGNISADPLFADPENGDFHLTWANCPIHDSTKSPCIDAGDPASPLDPDSTIADMGAYYFHHQAGTLIPPGHVSGTWTIDFSPYFISGEISIPTDSTLVIEPGVLVIFSGHHKLNIYGRLLAEGTALDTIVFTAQDTTVGWHSLRFYDTNDNGQDSSKVAYCKLEYGKATGISPDNCGGAIYCYNSSDILIQNCLIANNAAHDGGGIFLCEDSSPNLINVTINGNNADSLGGGIYCYIFSSPSLNNVTISGNTANYLGGGIYNCFSSPSLTNVIITGNSASENGGGIYCLCSNPNLINVIISGNTAYYGGGMYCDDNSNPNLTNVNIIENCAYEGGGIYCYNSSPNLINVTISGNSVILNGGGIFCYYYSSPILTNVTISENSADNDGGGIYNCLSSISLLNCILWNDSPQEIYESYYSTVTVSYSDIQGGWSGTDNIDEDPLFADPESGDFHLTWANFPIQDSTKSPCIDTGNPDSIYNDPDGTRNDMGAFYFDQGPNIPPGNVSGIWTISNSPYIIGGEINIPTDSTLVIEPGVQVIFFGHHKFNIYGRLLAEGTASDTIVFTAQDTIVGWHGLRFYDTDLNGQDSSKVVYCKLEYGKAAGNFPDNCGGAIYCYNSSDIFINNIIITNSTARCGGGAYFYWYSSPNLLNITISNNSSIYDGGGIGLYLYSSPSLTNVTISKNTTGWGGGIHCYNNCNPNLSNVTVSNNLAINSGGGIYCVTNANPSLVNSILWDNSPQEICFCEAAGPNSITIAYSDIQGGESAIVTNNNGTVNWLDGNIDADPLFADPESGDFHLTWANFPIPDSTKSPCIDAGDPDPMYYDPDGTRNDMGAYYFDQTQNYFHISGNIGYFSDDDPIPDVEVNLTGVGTYSTTTTTSGDYFLVDIPGGNYISTPSKADDLSGLSGLDASRIARYAALLYEFDCLEMIAGDVSMNGNISGTDASRVARYVAFLITELNGDGIDWVFTPEPIPECNDWPPIVYENTREYSPLNSDLTDEDFIAIRLGDVSGNWTPDSRVTLSSESFEAIEFETNINSILKIPIVIENVTEIEGIDIEISFNPEVLKLTELSLNEGILNSKDYAIETNLTETGKGTMVIYAKRELVSESGVVAFVEFDVIGVEGSKTDVYFTKFDINETEALGGLQVVVSEGKEVTTKRLEVNIIQPIPDKFALYQNYPNPFDSKTFIRYDLPQDTYVNIQIYNVRGQLVKELVNGFEQAGRKQIEWDVLEIPSPIRSGTAGTGMSSGIYFCKLSTKDKTIIKKMILIR